MQLIWLLKNPNTVCNIGKTLSFNNIQNSLNASLLRSKASLIMLKASLNLSTIGVPYSNINPISLSIIGNKATPTASLASSNPTFNRSIRP